MHVQSAVASVPAEPQPLLRRLDAVGIIVGIVIGAGIFKTPPMIAGLAGDPGWVIAAWIAGGIISLAGALCYAELASAFPHAGGDYHFLTRAYGRHVSFLYAWARATVINTGSIALLAFVFADYFASVFGIPAGGGSNVFALLVVIALTILNIAGLRLTARAQNAMTLGLVLGLVALVLAAPFAPLPDAAAPQAFSAQPATGMLGLAMVFVLLTYGGWNEAAYISAELKGGRNAIVGALVISIGVIAALYIAVNVALISGLGFKALADSKTAGADLMTRAFGPWAGQALGAIVSLAVLTSINGTMITGARTNYAMGRDWPSLRFLSGWNATRGVPVMAYIVQALIAIALIGFGSLQHDGFEAMVEFTAPVFWLFFFLVGVSLFVLRARHAAVERPFRVPLYPVTPLLFCMVCAYLFYSSVMYAASKDAVHVSLVVMAIGIVALALTGAAGRTGRKV
ncbi:MAG TPA: amino acid permease [Casimicrobiaceae bacterium]|nr:amino acid permease [Casimicrobiaceae bacterium]